MKNLEELFGLLTAFAFNNDKKDEPEPDDEPLQSLVITDEEPEPTPLIQSAVPRNYNPANRPLNWTDFVGASNTSVIDRLKMALSAANKEQRQVPHILLFGSPGLGKTTLSRIIAREMDAEIIETVGSALNKQQDIFNLFINIQEIQDRGRRAVLFIDELHDIASDGTPETLWFPIFEEYIFHHNLKDSTIVRDGQKFTITAPSVYLEPFTIIGATTDPGVLTQPLRDRFPVACYLQSYTIVDLAEIVSRYAKRIKVAITTDATVAIARRARGTPRTAINLLLACRDRASVEDKPIDLDVVNAQMRMDGIDEEGLTVLDMKVLKALASSPKGLGLANLAGASGVNRTTISEMVEPFLKQLNYTETTNKRFITKKGLLMLKRKQVKVHAI